MIVKRCRPLEELHYVTPNGCECGALKEKSLRARVVRDSPIVLLGSSMTRFADPHEPLPIGAQR